MTGLIYVILIAIWAAVLVPRFLRHHDETRRRRGTERLEAALAPDADLAPADSGHRAGSWAEYLRSLTDVHATPWVTQLRAPQGRHARRRRAVVLSLAGAMAVSMLGAVVGVLPGFLAVVAAVLLGSYVTVMFTQMRRWESGAVAAEPGPVRREAASETSRERSTDGVRVVRTPEESGAGSAWEPRETTLPTYVNKPKASRIPRRIDLTRSGWTAAEMLEEARRRQGSADAREHFDREFQAVEPQEDRQVADYAYPESGDEGYYRRAVNE